MSEKLKGSDAVLPWVGLKGCARPCVSPHEFKMGFGSGRVAVRGLAHLKQEVIPRISGSGWAAHIIELMKNRESKISTEKRTPPYLSSTVPLSYF
jgi:hypothetical protein